MSRRRGSHLAFFLIASVLFAATSAALVFSGVLPPFSAQGVSEASYESATFDFDFTKFSELPGWRDGDQQAAIAPFLRSCAILADLPDEAPANEFEALGPVNAGLSLAGEAGDWRAACRAGADVATGNADAESAARAFFEQYFRPLRISAARAPKTNAPPFFRRRVDRDGLFTGYFEPVFAASLVQTTKYAAPLYQRPDDLVMVDLGAFRANLAGERIAGYVAGGALVPYPDHQAIDEGALGLHGRVIAWLDPNDLFFLQIQGSGRLRLVGGGEMRVGYDGQNGRPYTAVGRLLIDKGAIRREDISMQSIRAWLDAAPHDAARGLREANESYVFFKILDGLARPDLGPLGAGGAQLTAGRSLAVDQRYYPLGAPIWVSIPAAKGEEEINRLFVAQDAGGAIKGPVRGDIFFGAGEDAGAKAGAFERRGEMFALIPAPVAAKLALARGGK